MDAGLATVIAASVGAILAAWVGMRRLHHDEVIHKDARDKELQDMANQAAKDAIAYYVQRQLQMEADMREMEKDMRKLREYNRRLVAELKKAGLPVPPYPDTGDLSGKLEE